MRLWTAVVAAIVLFGIPGLALGYDPLNEFSRGAIVATPQIGGGINNDLFTRHTKITQVSATVRVSLLPLDPVGKGFWRGSLETGLEPWFQYYPEQDATAQGLKVAARYHFLGASPVFPYVEILAGAGGTSLNVSEIRSDFAVVLEAGVGLSYFVTEGVALTAGYRFQHISNAGIESPNQGINSDRGVGGVSFFFH